MTIEKLKRGQEIQDELHGLEYQLKKLADSKFILLSDLTHPCSRKFESTEMQKLNDQATAFCMRIINTKVKELQKEFSKL